jgi:hypothetical protein
MAGTGSLPTFRLEALNGRIAPIAAVQLKPIASQKRTLCRRRAFDRHGWIADPSLLLITLEGGSLPREIHFRQPKQSIVDAIACRQGSEITIACSRVVFDPG